MSRTDTPARAWSASEERVLRSVYPRKSWPELLRIFNRTKKAISSRAKVLRVTRSKKRFWTTEEDAELRRLYPRTPGAELARRFGCPLHAIYGHAKHLGLRQDPDFKRAHNQEMGRRNAQLPACKAARFKKGQVPTNKGVRRPGYAPGRMATTQFKKGQRPPNTLPVGSVVMNADGYLRRKISDLPEPPGAKGGRSKNWEFVHKRVWEDAHGPIPPGHRIWWKDGNHQNCALENLELLSDQEHMRRTSIHTMPPALKEVLLLKGAINRRITIQERKQRKIHAQEQTIGSARPPIRDLGSSEGRRQAHGH